MKKIFSLLPVLLLFFLTVFLFRQYIFQGKVPFAGNLLASFYQPWKSYPSPNYPNGPANKPIGFDSLRIFYPLRSLTSDSLKNLQLPLWNPYDFAGNTQLATYQSAVFFPLTPLFLFLPQIDAWSLTVFLSPFLASLFTYLFLRGLSLSKKASVIGGLAFGFSGGIIVLSEESFMSVYSLLVLPLVLLGLYKYVKTGKFRWFSLFTLALVSSILSGWFQSTLYVLILSFVWLVFLSFQGKKWKRFFVGVLGFSTALLIAGPHIIPNIESYLYSARGTTDAKYLFDLYLLQPWHLITYFAPDFFGNPGTYNYFDKGFYYEKIVYIGIVGLFLGLTSLFTLKKIANEWFFTVCWIITVSLGLSIPTSWFLLYTLHLPFISTILPSRVFLLSAFCLSVMAAFSLENFFKKPQKAAFVLALLVSFVSVGWAWVFLTHQKTVDPIGHYTTISYRNMILPTAIAIATIVSSSFLLFRPKIFKQIGFILLILLSIGSIIYFSDKYLYFSDRQFVFPTTPLLTKLSQLSDNNRIWSFGEGYMERNFATYYHLQSPEGYDSFYVRSYGEFVVASQNGGRFTTDIPRADAQLTGVGKLSEIINNPSLVKTLNILGIKYVFAKKSLEDEKFLDSNSQAMFQQTWTDGKYIIYENKLAYPRTFFIESYHVIKDSTKQLATIFSAATDLSKTVIVDKDPKIQQNTITLNATAKIVSYQPEKIIIQTNSNKTAMLLLSDNNYPGWKATIDNKQTEIFTADHTFRSIVVPSGKHIITFSYQPQSVMVGFYIGLAGVLLFIVVGFTISRDARKS